MVSNVTLEKIKAIANIEEIVSDFVKLKKTGSSFTGNCPFHNEKTGSFSVSPAKGIYKCFGCGKGGDVFSFVMEKEKRTFTEAIEWLADYYKVEVEYDGKLDKQQIAEKKDREKEITAILRWAEEWYHQSLLNADHGSDVWRYLNSRGIDIELVTKWRLGFAPDNYKNITDTIINNGWYQPALDIGLIKTKNSSNFDAYRGRLMIPHLSKNGTLLGFIGRVLDDSKPKYLNPPDSEIYSKSNELFALSTARSFISERGYVYLTEGQIDVITMHENGLENTVGTGGTALTREHILLLRKYTSHAVIVGDGDVAGTKAMMKVIDELLKFDMRVEVVVLPEGEDPDSFLRKNRIELNHSSKQALNL